MWLCHGEANYPWTYKENSGSGSQRRSIRLRGWSLNHPHSLTRSSPHPSVRLGWIPWRAAKTPPKLRHPAPCLSLRHLWWTLPSSEFLRDEWRPLLQLLWTSTSFYAQSFLHSLLGILPRAHPNKYLPQSLFSEEPYLQSCFSLIPINKQSVNKQYNTNNKYKQTKGLISYRRYWIAVKVAVHHIVTVTTATFEGHQLLHPWTQPIAPWLARGAFPPQRTDLCTEEMSHRLWLPGCLGKKSLSYLKPHKKNVFLKS